MALAPICEGWLIRRPMFDHTSAYRLGQARPERIVKTVASKRHRPVEILPDVRAMAVPRPGPNVVGRAVDLPAPRCKGRLASPPGKLDARFKISEA